MHYKCQCTVCGTGASFQGFLLQHQNYAALSVGAKLEVMEAISASHPVTQASSPPRQDCSQDQECHDQFWECTGFGLLSSRPAGGPCGGLANYTDRLCLTSGREAWHSPTSEAFSCQLVLPPGRFQLGQTTFWSPFYVMLGKNVFFPLFKLLIIFFFCNFSITVFTCLFFWLRHCG